MKYVHAFEEGSKEQKYLLGGKGANLAEMTNLGLPVPPGFTITTEACKAYMAGGDTLPDGLMDEVALYNTALPATRVVAHFQAAPEPFAPLALAGLASLGAWAARRLRAGRSNAVPPSHIPPDPSGL